MSAYLKFFELEQSPFEGRAQSRIVLGTPALRAAFASIETGLEEGVARICVSGGAGLGKTSLARALPRLLGSGTRVAIVGDPGVSWDSVRGSIAKQWGLEGRGLARALLIEAARRHRLVLVIDQAERASEEFLDHLDVVLSYRSENDEQVIQSVLFAELAPASPGDAPAPLLWWLDRIQTLQLEFAPLPRDGVASYIHRHLKRAGWRGDRLFTQEAAWAIHGYSGGIPGEVSSLCERLLTEAAARGLREIEAEFVHSICDEDPLEDEPWSLDEAFEELVLEQAVAEAREAEDASAGPPPPDPRDATDGPSPDAQEAAESAEGEADLPEAPTGPLPTFVEALAHFEDRSREADGPRDAEGTGPGTDASLVSLERILSAPPSLEELRAIRGSLWRRTLRLHGKAVAAAALAALVGGLALLWIGGGGRSDADRTDPGPGRESRQADRPDAPGPSATRESPPVLARLRGPVLPPESAARDPESGRTEHVDPNRSTADTRQVLQTSGPARARPTETGSKAPAADPTMAQQDESLDEARSPGPEAPDEDAGEEEIIDLRPAAMIPDDPGDPDADRFW
ncbi:MAG TPA: hypothetical protein ENI85_03695 [Deltaproteobacteria bacterium]|nr:hypothetical protein [Deltaproteobacteria bacterium]